MADPNVPYHPPGEDAASGDISEIMLEYQKAVAHQAREDLELHAAETDIGSQIAHPGTIAHLPPHLTSGHGLSTADDD
ncbi:hypothetical protein ABZ477_05035 [Microbacterium sp. NPDC019599]|uniref:hypothetical protein n=1 Tax=Microbacterium sp. NPDC019599 TaxID=3154690 RepID=UPI0033FD36F7